MWVKLDSYTPSIEMVNPRIECQSGFIGGNWYQYGSIKCIMCGGTLSTTVKLLPYPPIGSVAQAWNCGLTNIAIVFNFFFHFSPKRNHKKTWFWWSQSLLNFLKTLKTQFILLWKKFGASAVSLVGLFCRRPVRQFDGNRNGQRFYTIFPLIFVVHVYFKPLHIKMWWNWWLHHGV